MCNYLVDKETQESVKHSSKTYHQHCFEQFELGKQHRRELHEYICELYNMPVVSGFILKQIKEFEDNYGYKLGGMKLALYYFHVIEGNPVESSNDKYRTQGIGIIPYVYDDARNHFEKMQRIQKAASEKTISTEAEVIYVKPPKKKRTNYIDIEGIK